MPLAIFPDHSLALGTHRQMGGLNHQKWDGLWHCFTHIDSIHMVQKPTYTTGLTGATYRWGFSLRVSNCTTHSIICLHSTWWFHVNSIGSWYQWGSGWWYTYPSEKWWSEFVSWDDDIPNCFWKVIKFHGSSHHQPGIIISLLSMWTSEDRHRNRPLDPPQISDGLAWKNICTDHHGIFTIFVSPEKKSRCVTLANRGFLTLGYP